MNIVWHYTIGQCLDKIIADGFVRPATAGVPKGERPAVWFSAGADWDETANKMYAGADGAIVKGTRKTTHDMGGGLARIGVAPETAPLDWMAFKLESGIDLRHAKALYQVAIKGHSRPGQWRMTFDPVPRSAWLRVELYDWDAGEWRPHPAFAGTATGEE